MTPQEHQARIAQQDANMPEALRDVMSPPAHAHGTVQYSTAHMAGHEYSAGDSLGAVDQRRNVYRGSATDPICVAASHAHARTIRDALNSLAEVQRLTEERDALRNTITNSDAPALLAEVTRLCKELRVERDKLSNSVNLYIKLADTLRAERDDMTAGLVEAGEEVLILRAERDKLRAALQSLMVHYVGERNSTNVVGESGIAADAARAALERPAP